MSDDEFIAKIESHFALYRLNLRSSLITHVALGSWYRVEVYLVNEVGLFRRADIEPDGRVEIGCDLLKATTDDALTPLVVDTDYRLELRSPQSQSQSQSQNNAIGFLASGKAAFEYRVISTSAGTPILGDRYLRIYPTHLHKFPKQSRGSNGDFILPLVVGPLVLTKVSPYSGSLPSYTSAEDWPEGTEMVYQGYRLFDSTIAIHETWDAGIPGKIWDSALVMLGFLKRMAEEKPDRIRGKHIIDLSAGTGLLGLQIAASMVTDLPKQPGRVTITEVEEALGLIQENVLLNKHLKRTCDLQLRSLLWGDAKQARACGKADVIVASDVLYESEYFEDLVQTFVDLSTSDTRIYIGYKRRGFDAAEEDRFWSLCRAHFQVTLIETQDEDTEFVPPLAKHVHVQLFRLQQKTVQRQ